MNRIDNLYYGHLCSCCGVQHFDDAAVTNGFKFDYGLLDKALHRIYQPKFDSMTMIERNLFDATLKVFNTAADKGFGTPKKDDPEHDFYEQIKTNNEVWSAFRTHRMQQDLAAQLIDSDGKLKPFKKWSDDVQPIVDHHVKVWMQTEYDTAILRAHQAADWQQFIREKDILPNLRWMPTTSLAPDPIHEQYWSIGLTLPIDDGFWAMHRPGDRWNCKCTLEATDEPATDDDGVPDTSEKPDPGLDSNPGQTGELISRSHPFIADAPRGTKKAVDNFLEDYRQEE